MSVFKHLGIKKGTSTWAVPIYNNEAEAGSAYSYIKIGGTTGYIPLCTTDDSRATAGRVKEHTGTIWAIATSGTPAYKKVTYTTPGRFTFTVPAGVTKLRVEVAGGGGGGGGGETLFVSSGITGGNGGSGAKTNMTITVAAGSNIAVIVGAGGAGGVGKENGGTGGTSKVDSVSARGGDGGTYGGFYLRGSNGTSYGSGGAGGLGAHTKGSAQRGNAGANGWVIIEYGQGVQ